MYTLTFGLSCNKIKDINYNAISFCKNSWWKKSPIQNFSTFFVTQGKPDTLLTQFLFFREATWVVSSCPIAFLSWYKGYSPSQWWWVSAHSPSSDVTSHNSFWPELPAIPVLLVIFYNMEEELHLLQKWHEMSQLKSLQTSEHEEQWKKKAENSFSPTVTELIFFYLLPHFFHNIPCREVWQSLEPHRI